MTTPRYVLLLTILVVGRLSAEEKPLLQSLWDDGVVVTATGTTKLPQPTLIDGLTAREQRERLLAIPENRHTWESLTRRSHVAPFIMRIRETAKTPEVAGYQVDVWFVAFGDIRYLASDPFLNSQVQSASDAENSDTRIQARLLEDKELKERSLTARQSVADTKFVASELTLLDRVRIRGTTRNEKTLTDESVSVASILDKRFNADAEFPNVWQALARAEAGQRQLGASQLYDRMGSYVRATRLVEPPGAMLIEYHLVYAEPQAWFNGANLLRSKLPIVIQDGVRRLRRQISANADANLRR